MGLFFPSGRIDVYIERSVRDCKQHPHKHNTYELPGRIAGVYLQSDTLEFNSKVKSSEVNWYLWYSPSRLVLWLFVRLLFTVLKLAEGESIQSGAQQPLPSITHAERAKHLKMRKMPPKILSNTHKTTDRSNMVHAALLVTGSDVCGLCNRITRSDFNPWRHSDSCHHNVKVQSLIL